MASFSFPAKPGEMVIVTNHNKGAATYRAVFPGGGWVEFVVVAGSEFKFCVESEGPYLDIKNFTPAGLRALDD